MNYVKCLLKDTVVRENHIMHLMDQIQNIQHNGNKVYIHNIKIKVNDSCIVVFLVVYVFVNGSCFVFQSSLLLFWADVCVWVLVCVALGWILNFFSFIMRRIQRIVVSNCTINSIFSIFIPSKNCNIFEHIKSFLAILSFENWTSIELQKIDGPITFV